MPKKSLDSSKASTMAPQRVMRILEALAAHREGLTLTQLAVQTELPKTSLFSLLHSLSEAGYVVNQDKTHRLGPEAFRIAALIHRIDSFPGNVHDLLEQFQQDSGETVMIGTPTEDWMNLVYVDVVESNSSLRFSIKVGAYRPLYSTTVGKILLAYATPEQQARYFEHTELIAINSNTTTDAAALKRELEQARMQGYIFSSGSVEGATGLAAPILNTQGKVIAALGTAGPSERFKNQQKKLIELVTNCAETMSRKIGYGGKWLTLKP